MVLTSARYAARLTAEMEPFNAFNKPSCTAAHNMFIYPTDQTKINFIFVH